MGSIDMAKAFVNSNMMNLRTMCITYIPSYWYCNYSSIHTSILSIFIHVIITILLLACPLNASTSSKLLALSMAYTMRNPSPVLMYWSLIALWNGEGREVIKAKSILHVPFRIIHDIHDTHRYRHTHKFILTYIPLDLLCPVYPM